MNKKMIFAFAITQLILIGSLLAFASDSNQNNTTTNETNDICPSACEDYDSTCKGAGYCHSDGDGNCDGSGICSQNQQQTKSCDSLCDGSGLYGQNEKRSNNCIGESSCSGICNN